MPKYRCRTVKPKVSPWFDQESETPELAANDFHDEHLNHVESLSFTEEKDDKRHEVKFAMVEVEGQGEWVSRIYRYGLYRRGGVKRRIGTPLERLTLIAEALGWTHGPLLLIEEGWEGEETEAPRPGV